jgi:FkbH-like protein
MNSEQLLNSSANMSTDNGFEPMAEESQAEHAPMQNISLPDSHRGTGGEMVGDTVKLVIWDLDDTFWSGTLAEEGMAPLPRNVEAVKELARRGIISSICSKNDFERARNALMELGVYEYFVFPRISYESKGNAVSDIIGAAALRPKNVLFIDDNPLNLAEVKFFNPGIMAHHPSEVLEGILHHKNLAGKPDPGLVRLKQYQLLQKKFEEKATSDLSNVEFLRSCNIAIKISPDVGLHFDRIVELINRTNQLNYTKQRLNTAEEIDTFRKSMNLFGYHAGCVFATDNYGDYGLIGFYLLHRRAGIKKLIQFVFSCRTMNMGIEQFVYEMLGCPDIDVVGPVSYDIRSHDAIDWINEQSETHGTSRDSARKLLLLGGCDLLQLASYCSSDREEFVNKIHNGMKVRFDDPGFVLCDRTAIRDAESIKQIPLWTYDDAVNFDAAVRSSEISLISMWPAVKGVYLRTYDNVLLHLNRETYRKMRRKYPEWFERQAREIDLDLPGRLDLIAKSFHSICASSPAGGRIFLLGCYTLGETDKKSKKFRNKYNKACRKYCERTEKCRYVDIDEIVPQHALLDRAHFSREGYFALAQHILNLMGDATGNGGKN